MLMTYGLFVFALSSAAYQDLQRQTQWRHPSQGRVGERPGRQFLGPGDDTITLTGTLAPPFTGGQESLDALRDMASDGNAWPLIEGSGLNYGFYVIESLDERKSALYRDGAAGRIAFTLSLARVDEPAEQTLPVLDPNVLGIIGTLTGVQGLA